jgi:gliding motility-associated-like protein
LSCSDCFDPSASPDETTFYQIVIQDDQNCEYFLQTIVEVIPSSNIFASNVFTPNQDGINDYFLLQSQDPEAKLIEFQVFNRWGAMVYSEKETLLNAMQGWDGMYKGSSQMAQVCVYHAKIELSDGRIEEMSGDVTIIR